MAAKRKPAKKRTKRETLNPEEEKFCQHYALNSNGADAVRHAFPKWQNRGAQDIAVKASKLLAQSKIKARTQHLAAKAVEIADKKFEVTVERVLQELSAIAFANADDYFRWGTVERPMFTKNGAPMIDSTTGEQMKEAFPFATVKDSDSLTRTQKAAIVGAEMTFSKAGDPMVSVKMADKRAALKDLLTHLTPSKPSEMKLIGPVQVVVSSAEAAL